MSHHNRPPGVIILIA